MATGIKRVLPRPTLVFTYQGDGDLASIGTAEIVHAATRGEKITVIFVNNAIYGMTGGQMAPTTLPGQVTTTSPYGRDVSHWRLSRARQRDAGHPRRAGLHRARQRARRAAHQEGQEGHQEGLPDCRWRGKGFTLVEVLSTCPTNWGKTPKEAFEWLKSDMLPYLSAGRIQGYHHGRGPGVMEKQFLIAGFGGQGVLLIGQLIAKAAMLAGL